MLTAKHTIGFSCVGYLTQAISINFAPLLFVTFENDYGISMSKISVLIAISFATQFLIDFLAANLSEKMNLRAVAICAHVSAAIGMIAFACLPDITHDPFLGLTIAVIIAALGGGLIEVVISPIVAACPVDQKSGALSFLHSFYSWGLVAVVLLSTIFFKFFGIENWRILSALWAIVPLIGGIGFCFVPIYNERNVEDNQKNNISLFRTPIFWMFLIIMLCTGAAEQAMSQWASVFAETGLGVSKTMGDLLGPLAFAVLMGSARVFYGLFSTRINLEKFMYFSCILCIISYLLASLSPSPILSLVGCALCGLSVGIQWPGTYSLATKHIPSSTVRMFALLAFAGDLGCLVGPAGVGFIAGKFDDNLKIPFLCAIIFPVLILLMLKMTRKQSKNNKI